MSRSISIAVLDSGINPQHSHVQDVEGGVWIRNRPDKEIADLEGVHPDFLGHGTAVAGVIRWFAPRCSLYSIKIFDRALSTTLPILLRGIEWALEKKIDIINLSLGTANPQHLPPLALLCKRAHDQGTIVIAAAEGRQHYPAILPTVIGVSADGRCKDNETFYLEGDLVAFRALGQPRPLPSFPPGKNLRGSSFAAARVGGLVAAFWEQTPSADVDRVKAFLIARSHLKTESDTAILHPDKNV